MSDEREGAGSADTGTGPDNGDNGSQTAVVTRPQRPTGKRSRRGAVTESDSADSDEAPETDSSGGGDDGGKGGGPKKTAKKPKDGPSRNPFAFVLNYLQEVIGELRKVIWPNRKQMVTYTTVVLIFLAFMVALIGFTDLGLARLVTMVFG
ncbi:preprotein translocase subunit SecE [Mycolicibacterium hippocampi]|uniref:Protein translocase subunit SecE n=1 Tax=Mycolicibacterium hippocampi TaxID=659824 RepID=A0A7I9ZLG5_9MYCO|nr:preprotein translocase subunit SecE [Mycolicibacterium hippocampi]GFH01547.1 protein translocase subunit SecE [Mycolicibacterium hippocampi]